jgi:hypothetical protein
MFADPTSATPPDAISAVKALAKASAAGQRIYQLTQANQTSTLPNIHHDAQTMDEIRAALAIGKEVITHTDAVSVPGWSGAGYIILDPTTGNGAYKISGGANGGLIDAGEDAYAALSVGYGFLFAAFEGDRSFVTDAVKKQLFFTALKTIGQMLGIAALLVDIVELWAKCGPEIARAMAIILTLVTIMTMAISAAFTPVMGFIFGQLIGVGVTALKDSVIDSAACQ